MLRGNLHAYMDMIRHQVAFNDPAFLLTCQLMEDGPQGFTNVAIHSLPAPLGDKHDVVLAIPPRMRQALIGVDMGFSFGVHLSGHRRSTLLPDRSKLCMSHWSNQWLTSKIELSPMLGHLRATNLSVPSPYNGQHFPTRPFRKPMMN